MIVQTPKYDYDVIILGSGISGKMLSKRIAMYFPEFKVALIDKGPESSTHPFHLHRPIQEMPSLSSIRKVKFFQGTYSDSGFSNCPTIEDANQYALKVFGKIQITNCHNCKDIEIFVVSKSDLLEAFSEKTHVSVTDTILSVDIKNKVCMGKQGIYSYKYLVNTIPLPAFLSLSEIYCGLKFTAHSFYTSRFKLNEPSDLFQMLYVSHGSCNITRTTLLDQDLFIESVSEAYTHKDLTFLFTTYGIKEPPALAPIYPGRFNILPTRERKSLFYWMTEKHSIFCLGRYGAWTHKVANDVWDDTKFICQLIYNKEQVQYYEKLMKGPDDETAIQGIQS